VSKSGRFTRRLSAAIAGFAIMQVADAVAQSYPAKPIRIVVGFTASSGPDVTARMVAQNLSRHLGQPVTVENRAGASGAIAAELVAKAPADGHTLLLATATDSIVPALRANLPYDLARDFTPVSLVALVPLLLVVHPSVPARNVRELIALARAHPGKLSYGSSGVGSSTHLVGELLNQMARTNIVHVPYKGSTESLIAVASGQIDISFPSLAAGQPLLGAGKFRVLAITTAKRASLMPAIPTLSESGLPGYDRSSWQGVLAPAGVPRDVVVKLNAAIARTVNASEIKESFFNKQGLEPQTNSPEEFGVFIQRELAQNAKLVRAVGVKPE